MGTRAKVEVFGDRTIKKYDDPVLAAAEAAWFIRVPWATPRLLDFDGTTLTIETGQDASEVPEWRPVGVLRELLGALHAEGVHHRDVHVKNVVRLDGEPRLIDWETAIIDPAPFSYDLYGPEDSGIPIPKIHTRLIPMWWGSRQRLSIKNQWEVRR